MGVLPAGRNEDLNNSSNNSQAVKGVRLVWASRRVCRLRTFSMLTSTVAIPKNQRPLMCGEPTEVRLTRVEMTTLKVTIEMLPAPASAADKQTNTLRRILHSCFVYEWRKRVGYQSMEQSSGQCSSPLRRSGICQAGCSTTLCQAWCSHRPQPSPWSLWGRLHLLLVLCSHSPKECGIMVRRLRWGAMHTEGKRQQWRTERRRDSTGLCHRTGVWVTACKSHQVLVLLS